MTNHNIKTSLTIALFGSMLAFAACDSGDGKDAKDAKATKKDGKTAVTKVEAKASDKKTDVKEDAKAEAKAEDTKEGEPTTAVAEAPKEPEVDVVKTAAIAKEIEANPANADSILEKNGMDRTKFEIAIAAIAKDELKSDMYIQALTAESKGTG